MELQTPEFKILKEVYYKIFCSSKVLEMFQIVLNACIQYGLVWENRGLLDRTILVVVVFSLFHTK